MAHDNEFFVVIDFCVMLNAFKVKAKPTMDTVVITSDEVLVSIQSLNELYAVFLVLPEGITENVNRIILGDTLIPVMNKDFIHKGGIRKRSVVKADNILMAKMRIRNVIDHSVSTSVIPFLRLSAEILWRSFAR